MFDWLLPEEHAITLLKKDHETLKSLFEAFEKAETPAARNKAVEQALVELKIHAVLEEEIFYPTVRKHVGGKIMNEADEEHHVAKVLVAELDNATRIRSQGCEICRFGGECAPPHQGRRGSDASESKGAEHRFSGSREADDESKTTTCKSGIPRDAEHDMIKKAGARADSPAAVAKRKKPAVRREASTTAVKRRAVKR